MRDVGISPSALDAAMCHDPSSLGKMKRGMPPGACGTALNVSLTLGPWVPFEKVVTVPVLGLTCEKAEKTVSP